MDTQFFENEKIEMLMANFGFEASGVYIKLLCKIYTNGYYMRWNETICKVFTYSLHSRFNSKKVQQIIDFLVEFNFFNKKLFLEHQILTSKGIQERFFEIISRRKNFVCENVEYLLVPIPKRFSESKNGSKMQQSSPLNDEKCNISGDSTGENVDISKQSKVNESIVKESIVKESKVKNLYSSSSSSACACAREANGVIVSEEEIKKPNSFSENCKKWNAELMKDEEWLSSVVRSSGKGSPVLRLLPEIMDYFEQHIVSIGETGSVININDYKRRLINWWRYLKFQSVPEILEQQNSKPRKNREEKKSKVDEAMECAQKASVIAQRLLDGGGL